MSTSTFRAILAAGTRFYTVVKVLLLLIIIIIIIIIWVKLLGWSIFFVFRVSFVDDSVDLKKLLVKALLAGVRIGAIRPLEVVELVLALGVDDSPRRLPRPSSVRASLPLDAVEQRRQRSFSLLLQKNTTSF